MAALKKDPGAGRPLRSVPGLPLAAPGARPPARPATPPAGRRRPFRGPPRRALRRGPGRSGPDPPSLADPADPGGDAPALRRRVAGLVARVLQPDSRRRAVAAGHHVAGPARRLHLRLAPRARGRPVPLAGGRVRSAGRRARRRPARRRPRRAAARDVVDLQFHPVGRRLRRRGRRRLCRLAGPRPGPAGLRVRGAHSRRARDGRGHLEERGDPLRPAASRFPDPATAAALALDLGPAPDDDLGGVDDGHGC